MKKYAIKINGGIIEGDTIEELEENICLEHTKRDIPLVDFEKIRQVFAEAERSGD